MSVLQVAIWVIVLAGVLACLVVGLAAIGGKRLDRRIEEHRALPSPVETDWAEWELYVEDCIRLGEEPDLAAWEANRTEASGRALYLDQFACPAGGNHDPMTVSFGVLCADCRQVFCHPCDRWHEFPAHRKRPASLCGQCGKDGHPTDRKGICSSCSIINSFSQRKRIVRSTP